MAVALLDLVGKILHAAKQALGNRAGRPASGGLPREAHIVAHCLRREEGHTFTELVDRLGLMPEVCELLGLHPDALPDPTTFYHSLDRYAMYVWRALLRVSAQQKIQLFDDSVHLVKRIEKPSIWKVKIFVETVDHNEHPVSVAAVTLLDRL